MCSGGRLSNFGAWTKLPKSDTWNGAAYRVFHAISPKNKHENRLTVPDSTRQQDGYPASTPCTTELPPGQHVPAHRAAADLPRPLARAAGGAPAERVPVGAPEEPPREAAAGVQAKPGPLRGRGQERWGVTSRLVVSVYFSIGHGYSLY